MESNARDLGYLEWKKRMGTHLAYHQHKVNKIIHLFSIPTAVFSLLLIMTSWGKIYLLDLGIIALTGLFVLYKKADFIIASVVTLVHIMMWMVSHILYKEVGSLNCFLLGFCLFILASLLQIGLGHGTLEGIDDTDLNFKEFWLSKNPAPLFLIIFYHYYEIFMYFGYKPENTHIILKYEKEYLEKIRKKD
jgi:uncharacterized membrane protein YGL010W